MGVRKLLDGNMAMAEAMRRARVGVISAYPITPQSPVAEKLSEYVADGSLHAEYIRVESEHTALSCAIGAQMTGVRACTATSSVGLALMHEVLGIASGCRIPIVMGIINRSLAAPWSLWCDHQDAMAERDAGWLQIYAGNVQEVFDYMIYAYKLAEHEKILLPAMVCQDGFFLSHTAEVAMIASQERVDAFLPRYTSKNAFLDVNNPMFINNLTPSAEFCEMRCQQKDAFEAAKEVAPQLIDEFEQVFGRKLHMVDSYRCEDAETVLVTIGSMSGTAKHAVDILRKQGKKNGVLRLVFFRPFPYEMVTALLRGIPVVGVLDRSAGLGAQGAPVYMEVQAAVGGKGPKIVSMVAGLGGRDISVATIIKAFQYLEDVKAGTVSAGDQAWIDVRPDYLQLRCGGKVMYQIETDAKGLVAYGVSTCHGCGLELVIRTVIEELGPHTIIVIPPGCSALFSGYANETALKIPGFQGNLENTAAYASGISRGLRFQGIEDVHVLGFAGDGATVDIGLQSLSGAMERNENIIYVCYDNEAYMNTGIQGSGSTTYQAWTTTTPNGKEGMSKDMMMIAKAHGIPYAATASIGYLDDLKKKVEKAKQVKGMAYLHVSAPCPTGWGYQSEDTVKIARLAVETGAWILYEMTDGRVRINKKMAHRKPVREYLKVQKRFSAMSEESILYLETQIEKNYREIQYWEKYSKGDGDGNT